MITLKNDYLEVKIAERGAEVKSIVYNNTQYIWEGDPKIWGSSCPLLFPICGGLKEDKYTLDDKEYTLEKHGFIRKKTFCVEHADQNTASFVFYGDDQSKNSFPFEYELRVIYNLSGKTLKIYYSVKNIGNKPMYFNIGSHEGYKTPEGIEEYDIVFPFDETLNTTVLNGNLLTHKSTPIIKNSNTLPLSEKYFEIDALVFTSLKSRSIILKSRTKNRAVKIDFPDDEYLLLWHVPGAKFICIEPWNGIPDREGTDFDITEKEGITRLSGNAEFNHTHSITIIE